MSARAAAISVIVPARNEAPRVAATLHAARAALGDDCELIVVDAHSADATRALARAAGARVLDGPPNRGAQLRIGEDAARADVLLFLHADTRLPADAGRLILDALADPDVAGGAFRVRFAPEERPSRALRALARAIGLRSRLFRTATGDQAIFARASALRAAGGVPPIPLFEDVRLYRALRKQGRMVLLDACVATSPRRWVEGGTARVVTQHLCLRALHAVGVSPATLARLYGTGKAGGSRESDRESSS